jgi:uncharacterized lipoprotein
MGNDIGDEMKLTNDGRARFARPVLFLIFLLMSSCAVTQEHINVGYEPQTGVSRVLGAESTTVQVEVEDQRTTKNHVGHKSNPYGMEMAEIIADNDIPQTIKSAVESELTDRGFALGANGAVIVVQLIKFENVYKNEFWSFSAVGKVTLRVTVKRSDGTDAYTNAIYGQGVNSGVQISGGQNVRIALEAALKNAITTLFSDNDFLNALSVAGAKSLPKT